MKSIFSRFFFRWPKWARALPLVGVILPIAASGYVYQQNRQAQASGNNWKVMP